MALNTDYPRMLFHRTREPVTVRSREEEDALGDGWSRKIWPPDAEPSTISMDEFRDRYLTGAVEPEPEEEDTEEQTGEGDTPQPDPEPEPVPRHRVKPAAKRPAKKKR